MGVSILNVTFVLLLRLVSLRHQNLFSSRANNIQMVKNLVSLISGATIGDLAGLEELIGILVASKDIEKSCFQVRSSFISTQ